MTQDMTGRQMGGQAGTSEVVKQETGEVAHTAMEAGGQVAGVAAEQAREVAGEVRDQARDLMREGRQQVREQAVVGQQKAASGLGTVADELGRMADSSDGMVGGLARQGADRVRTLADWLGARDPSDLVDEIRRWARQRPGTFLVGAAVAGVVAGRLTRGTIAGRSSGPDTGNGTASRPARHQAASVPDTYQPTQSPPVMRETYGAVPGAPLAVDAGQAAIPAVPYPAPQLREARPSDLGGRQ